jgi:hypothetical protein
MRARRLEARRLHRGNLLDELHRQFSLHLLYKGAEQSTRRLRLWTCDSSSRGLLWGENSEGFSLPHETLRCWSESNGSRLNTNGQAKTARLHPDRIITPGGPANCGEAVPYGKGLWAGISLAAAPCPPIFEGWRSAHRNGRSSAISHANGAGRPFPSPGGGTNTGSRWLAGDLSLVASDVGGASRGTADGVEQCRSTGSGEQFFSRPS